MLKNLVYKIWNKLQRLRIKVLGGHTYQKFVVLTRSRTGSNLLISLLNAHPNIVAHGEVFARLNNRSTTSIWNQIFSKKLNKTKYIGFKLFYYHPMDNDDKEVWKNLLGDPNIRIIHLQRKNLLRIHISRLIAGKTDLWMSSERAKTNLSEKKVSLDLNALIEDFKQTENWINSANHDFKNHALLEVSYEDLVAQNQEVMRNIFEFLSVPQIKVKSLLKKQNLEEIEDLVENYDQLVAKLSNNNYEQFLDKSI